MDKCAAETAEIERHKYFLSQRMGYDVGWEAAEKDWEENYGQAWRQRLTSTANRANESSIGSAKEAVTASNHRVDTESTPYGWLSRSIERVIAPFRKGV